MPELPEVEVISRFLAESVVGRRISEVIVLRRDLRIPVQDDFESLLKGQGISSVYRVAKYLIMLLEDGRRIVFHLGMSAKLIYTLTSNISKHDHLFFLLDNGYRLLFNDVRRFGSIVVQDDTGYMLMLEKIGPDPFSPEFNAEYIMRVSSNRSIKNMLMHGAFVAGIGNIYASEILFKARILPSRKAYTLSYEECQRIVKTTRDILELSISEGGSTIKDYRIPTGVEGGFKKHFKVYGKRGEKCCTCGESIQVEKQNGRSTFFCCNCQE